MDWSVVTDWLLQHGTRILGILVIGAGLWYALQKFLPALLRRTLVKIKGESQKGIEKRRDTLVSVFKGVGRVIIIIVAIRSREPI